MRTFKVAAFAAAMLMNASASGAVAAQDDPATNFADPAMDFGGVDRRPVVAPREDEYWFDNGFATLHDQIGSIMGHAIGPERNGDDGDVVQRTSTGLAVWKPGQAPRFTDGWRVWTTESPGEQRTATVAAAAPVVPYVPYGSVWDRLAGCEAGGNWANAANPRYKGGLQMDSTFWARYGGLAYASAPHLASRQAQITVAQRGQAVQGWGAWPTCSRILGLR